MRLLSRLTEKLFSFAGRKNLTLDSHLKSSEIASIVLTKGFAACRGKLLSIPFGSQKGLIFIGKRSRIIGRSRIFTGRNLNVEDNVIINALAKDGVHLGNNVSIRSGTIIECAGVYRDLGERLVVGNNVGFAQNCFVAVRGPVEIGDNTIFGPSAKIFAENHNFRDPHLPIVAQGETRKGVKIASGCWIGSSAIITDGVVLGSGCVVAAGSIVTKSFPAGSVLAGCPAKLIGNRNDDK